MPVSDAGQGRAQRVYRRALTGVWDWRIQHWQAEAGVLDGDLGVTILLLAIQNYPRDASEFIGHRDRHHISIGAGLEFSEPRTKRMTISSHSVLDGPTTVNEQCSEIFIAVLADAQKLRLAAREHCFGIRPSQAANSRPRENAAPFPIAATMAVAISTPMPGGDHGL